jgi:hypothetical protein
MEDEDGEGFLIEGKRGRGFGDMGFDFGTHWEGLRPNRHLETERGHEGSAIK